MSAEPDAGAQSTEVAGSAVVAALEDAWTAVRTHHPDVPQVVIVLGAGSETRRGLFKWGHFAAGRWHVAGANRPSRQGRWHNRRFATLAEGLGLKVTHDPRPAGHRRT